MGPLGKKLKNILILETDSKEKKFTKIIVYICISAVFLMIFIGIITFAALFEKKEVIKVPSVENLSLADAVVELQKKRLQVKVNAIYTENSSEKGFVIKQKPGPNKSVKEGYVVTLNVSKGVILEKVENYTGWTINEIENDLKARDSLIYIQKPVTFVLSDKERGTVIKQSPIEGSDVSSSTALKLIVSSGNSVSKYVVKNYVGMNYIDVIQELSNNNVVFNFTERKAKRGEVSSTVVQQSVKEGSAIFRNSGIDLVVATPRRLSKRYEFEVLNFDFPKYKGFVTVKVIKSSEVSAPREYFSLQFTGGKLSFPIYAQAGTVFTVYQEDEEFYKHVVSIREDK